MTKNNLPAMSRGACLTACCQTMRDLRAEIDRLQADLDDLQEKYAQSESNRLDAEAKLERLHQLIERKEPHAAKTEIDQLKQVINDASLGLEFTMQERFSGNLDEWDQATKIQLAAIMSGLDEVFSKE